MGKPCSFDDFRCPECGGRPDRCVASLFKDYSVRRLNLPYFFCPRCRAWGYSKQLLRENVSQWHRDPLSRFRRPPPFTEVWRDVCKFMDELLHGYSVRQGHRTIRFHRS